MKWLVILGALFLAGCALAACPVACTDGQGTIRMELATFDLAETNPDALAFIMAHEMAHTVLRHSMFDQIKKEQIADDWAIEFMSGDFNPCSIVPLLRQYDQPVRADRIGSKYNCP